MSINYERNRLYFETQSYSGCVLLIVLGIILIIVSFILFSNRYLSTYGIVSLVIGLGLGILGGILIWQKSQRKVSDREYDEAVAAEAQAVEQRALEILRLDAEQILLIKPINLRQYKYSSLNVPLSIKFGEDQKCRTSNYECIVMFCTEHQILCYQEQFSMTHPENKIVTNEYFYSDIDSIELTSSNSLYVGNVSAELKGNYNIAEKFTISIPSGSNVSLSCERSVKSSVGDERSRNMYLSRIADAEEEIRDIDRTLRGLIQLWRQKKSES